MTLSLHGHYTERKMLRETALKKVSLEAAAEDRQWGCRCNDRECECSIANGGPTSAADDEWWRRSREQTSSDFEIRRMAKFVGKVWRSCPMQTFVHEDSQLEINPLFRLQPMQLTEERGDVVKPRWWKHQLSSRVHHRLKPRDKVRRNTGEDCVAVIQPRQDKRRHQRLENVSRYRQTNVIRSWRIGLLA